MNHLEQLVAEWYEYNGYFVRKNVHVGKREKGGYECELDVVAYCPKRKHLVQIEPSTDAHTWATREERYEKKFLAGRKYIPELFSGLPNIPYLDQIAVFPLGKKTTRQHLAEGRVFFIYQLFAEIQRGLYGKTLACAAVPEQFPLLRTIQHCTEYFTAAPFDLPEGYKGFIREV